jgi:hypothetical protein
VVRLTNFHSLLGNLSLKVNIAFDHTSELESPPSKLEMQHLPNLPLRLYSSCSYRLFLVPFGAIKQL